MQIEYIIHKKLYGRWSGIKTRCYSPNCDHYSAYGGRGITMCERWLNDAYTFIEDVKKLPGYDEALLLKPNGLQLDKDRRVSGAKEYSPDT